MTAQEEGAHESASGFLLHLRRSHPTCLDGVDPNVMDNMRIFRSTVCGLPRDETAKAVSRIQECIDDCLMDDSSTSQGLKLLQDICSLSRLFPNSYGIFDVKKEKEISHGAEANIYAGRHRDRAVVIRAFHSNTEEPPEHLARIIIREIISHWQLRHPNIVALIGVHQFEEDHFPSAVLQRAEHSSATAFLKAHPQPQYFTKILLGLFEALHYLHSRSPPVIHGDLHDRNIVISDTGDCLLCDFGLSRIKHELSLTSQIHQGGPYRFIAPEIPTEQTTPRINQKSDMYSLAMTIYALGTKCPPFTGITPDRARRAARKGTRPSKPDSLGGLSTEHTQRLWALMEMMWHPDPQLRPTVSYARNEIAKSGIMNLEQGPAPVAATPTTTPLATNKTIQQVRSCNQWSIDASDLFGKSAQGQSPQHISGAGNSGRTPSLPFASSVLGMSGNNPAAGLGALVAASAGRYPWTPAPPGLRGYPWVGTPMQRLQGSTTPSLSFIGASHTANSNRTPPEVAPPSCVGSNRAGDTGGSSEGVFGDIGSVTKLVTVSDPPSSLPSPAEERARSYIPSPPPFGSSSSTEPATLSVYPSPLPLLGSLGIDPKSTVVGASSDALSSSPIKWLRSSTESVTARISASLSSPSLREDLGGSLPSAMAGARSYLQSKPPSFQSLRSDAASAAAVVTASLSSPSPLASLTNDITSAAASAGSYVLSTSAYKSFGSGFQLGANGGVTSPSPA